MAAHNAVTAKDHHTIQSTKVEGIQTGASVASFWVKCNKYAGKHDLPKGGRTLSSHDRDRVVAIEIHTNTIRMGRHERLCTPTRRQQGRSL
jgi:hypothetical protein